jgi:hypothetical protein
MRKLSAVLVVLLFMTGSAFATVITEVVLGPANGIITFGGLGLANPNELSIALGSPHVPNFVLAGRAIGTGSAALPGNATAPYKIVTPTSDVITASPSGLPGSWAIAQSGPEAFSWGKNGSLLTGTFNLVDFFQAPGTTVGVFNDTGIFNMTITGGSEAAIFGGTSASIDLVLKFQSTGNFQGLLGTNNSLRANLNSGEILPTPEPATLSLLRTGLLSISYVTRRRIRKVTSR